MITWALSQPPVSCSTAAETRKGPGSVRELSGIKLLQDCRNIYVYHCTNLKTFTSIDSSVSNSAKIGQKARYINCFFMISSLKENRHIIAEVVFLHVGNYASDDLEIYNQSEHDFRYGSSLLRNEGESAIEIRKQYEPTGNSVRFQLPVVMVGVASLVRLLDTERRILQAQFPRATRTRNISGNLDHSGTQGITGLFKNTAREKHYGHL